MPLPNPKTCAQWLELLDKQAMVAPADELLQINRVLADNRRSLREIAQAIQRAPTLALCIMREANRGNTGLSEPCSHLETALSRLGLERTASLLNSQPTAPTEQIPRQLRQLQLISQHAAQQANGLFAGRLARLWQDINWGSLLFLAPLWPLVSANPELFDEWEQRVLLNGEQAGKVEKQLLGLPLTRLCLALAEHWNLPEWIIQAYRLLHSERRMLARALHIARNNEQPLQQQHALDQDHALSRWLTHPANSVLLANAIALSAHHCWSGKHSMRWQQLSAMYLQSPVPEMQQAIHQQAVLSAQHSDIESLWHPAQALLWPWPTTHLQPPAPAVTVKADVQQWREVCSQLLQEPSGFSNIVQLSECAIAALRACGMQRVLLLHANRSQSTLKTLNCTFLAPETRELVLQTQQSQVLRSLLEKPAQLHLTPSNLAQVSALMPGVLKSLFPGEHLIMRSLAINQRVVMLLVADHGGKALGETQLQAFNKTAQCLERALASFAKRAG